MMLEQVLLQLEAVTVLEETTKRRQSEETTCYMAHSLTTNTVSNIEAFNLKLVFNNKREIISLT